MVPQTPLSDDEWNKVPSYLSTQLGADLRKLNEIIDTINEAVTDKRFEGAASDHLTHDEIAQAVRLGSRTKTVILVLITVGRLKGLDTRAPGQSSGAAPAVGAARYRIVAGGA